MNVHQILTDIHALEEELLEFERKYGLRSEIFYAAYRGGEEPEDEAWVLDFSEWASVYRTWLTRQAEYRNEVHRRRPRIRKHVPPDIKHQRIPASEMASPAPTSGADRGDRGSPSSGRTPS